MQEISSNYSAFLKHVLKAVLKDGSLKENLFFSPISIFICLALLTIGLSTNSQKELLDVLVSEKNLLSGKSNDLISQNLAHEVSTLSKFLLSSSMTNDNSSSIPRTTLNIANGLFVDQNFELLQSFVADSLKNFRTCPTNLDFSQNPAGSRQHINTWVEKNTENMIKDLLPASAITGDTKIVLVNTILFLGKWMQSFDPNLTIKNHSFYTFNQNISSENAEMMVKKNTEELYFETNDFSALTLPYSGDEFQITFFKPQENTEIALEKLENRFIKEGMDIMMNSDQIIDFEGMTMGNGKEKMQEIRIPKISFDHSLPLKDLMKKMGITSVFEQGTADFSKMAATPENLYVSDAFHKARVEIDEAGTKAAAATAIVVANREAGAAQRSKVFILDSPFFFVISHGNTTPLFYGRIVNL